MPVTFVRNLGHQPGVQLNPLVDPSEHLSSTASDQSFGVVARTTRGRIDRAFAVDISDANAKLGAIEPIRANLINEARAQLNEALTISGGYAVVSRLVRIDQAQIKWATLTVTDPVAPATTKTYTFGVSNTKLDTGFALQLKHMGCFNDGIKLAVWAEPVTSGGVEQPTKKIKLRVADAKDNALFFFQGSTDPFARDDYGTSAYLPDVVAARTDEIEVVVAPDAVFSPGEALYGYDANGFEKWLSSDVLVTFVEGDHAYTASDYQDAVDRLKYAQQDFSYIASGGTQSPALLSRLAVMAIDTNRQLRFDVAGSLDVDAAIAFVESLDLSYREGAHLLQAFWMPVRCDDPSGVNPNGYLGAAMLNVGMACRRNATVNANGLAAKNYPIAGRNYPIPRSGLRQSIKIGEMQLSNLARARINPVIFDTFADGSYCVFRDQITLALADNSLRRLISVVDMSTSIDDRVVRYGKSLINSYPMTMAVKRMRDYLKELFSAAETAGWLVPSAEMGGSSFNFVVNPNAERPYDKMDLRYSLRYDGALRQIEVTQSLSR